MSTRMALLLLMEKRKSADCLTYIAALVVLLAPEGWWQVRWL